MMMEMTKTKVVKTNETMAAHVVIICHANYFKATIIAAIVAAMMAMMGMMTMTTMVAMVAMMATTTMIKTDPSTQWH